MDIIVSIVVSADGEKESYCCIVENFSSLCQTNGIGENNRRVIILCVSLAVCWRSHLFVRFFVILFNCFFFSFHLQNFTRGIKRQRNSLALYFKVVSNWQKILLFQVVLFLQGSIVSNGRLSSQSNNMQW